MLTLNPRRSWVWVPPSIALIVALCTFALAIGATASAAPQRDTRSASVVTTQAHHKRHHKRQHADRQARLSRQTGRRRVRVAPAPSSPTPPKKEKPTSSKETSHTASTESLVTTKESPTSTKEFPTVTNELPPTTKESLAPVEESNTNTTLQTGMDAGWIYGGQLDLPAAVQLGAKLVRVEFPIEWTPAQLEETIAGYAEKGVRVDALATFEGRTPTPSEAKGLANWVKAYGPGGTFWAGRSDGQLAIQTIEFGNETSAGYQYGDNAGEPSYTARAEAYALRFKEAAEAISATHSKVGLLAVTGDWTGDWLNDIYRAVPNFSNYVAGWITHPYGTSWRQTLEELISQTTSHGAPSTIPIDITEWGLASDNGNCLTANYGWNPCMSYQEAAEVLRKTFAEMRQMLGSRLGMFMLYQVRDQAASGTSTNREDYFGLLQHELQPKGEYTTAAEEILAA